jgi:hypothetical protein
MNRVAFTHLLLIQTIQIQSRATAMAMDTHHMHEASRNTTKILAAAQLL